MNILATFLSFGANSHFCWVHMHVGVDLLHSGHTLSSALPDITSFPSGCTDLFSATHGCESSICSQYSHFHCKNPGGRQGHHIVVLICLLLFKPQILPAFLLREFCWKLELPVKSQPFQPILHHRPSCKPFNNTYTLYSVYYLPNTGLRILCLLINIILNNKPQE